MAGSLYAIYLVLIIIASVFIVQTIIHFKIRNKVLMILVGRERKCKIVLAKPVRNILSISDEDISEKYNLDTDRIVLVDYPFMLPSFLQTTIPCLVYSRNNPEPLDPKNVNILPKGMTAKQLASVMDERVVEEVVNATDESRKKRIAEWVLPVISIVMILIVFVVIYMMRQQIDVIATQVAQMSSKIK